jgi:hypothetical protein
LREVHGVSAEKIGFIPRGIPSSRSSRASKKRLIELPEINLQHLRALTDDTGMLHHALFSVPRYGDGYCLDDNARTLLLTSLFEGAGTDV